MTQKQNVIACVAAFIISLQSYVLWTGLVAGSLHSLHSYVLERHDERSDGTKPIDPSAPLVPTTAEPEVKQPEKVTQNVGERRQAQRELEQWEIKRWFTLAIPSLNIRAPAFLPSRKYWDTKRWDMLEEQMQVALLRGAAAYPHSVGPGKTGSLFVAGHSSPPNERAQGSAYGRLFQLLPNLKRGDVISLAQGNTVVSYKVIGLQVVPPNQTQILAQQSDQSLLVLITCYPIGTTKERLVVTAVKQA